MKRGLPGVGMGVVLAALAACVQHNSPETSARLQPEANKTNTFPTTASINTDINALYPPPPGWEKINAQLNAPIDDFDVDNQPLTAAFDKFRELTHLDMEINWVAISASAGVDINAPVTIHMHNVPARWVLAALLPYPTKGQSSVGYIIHDGRIFVATTDFFVSPKYRATYQYDIDPLLTWKSKSRGKTNDDATKEIISVITSTVDPNSWRSAGGSISALSDVNNILIIDQTEINQEQIRQLLMSMAAETIPTIRIYDVRTLIASPDKNQSTQRLADLEAMIRAHWPPDAWGNHSAIRAENGFLIISANALSQFRIAALLAAAREINSPHATVPEVAPVNLNALFPSSPDWENVDDKLNQNISDFSMDKQPLGAALDKLHNLTHLDFVIDWAKLNSDGVDTKSLVSIKLHNVSVRRILDTLLSALGEGSTGLGYAIHNGTVWISIDEDLQGPNYQVIRHYDIDPLLREVKNRGATEEDAIKSILYTIQATVDEDSWLDTGGTVGTIREWHHVLYVNQTEQNQEAIRQLLISLTAKAIPITQIYDVRPLIANPDKTQSSHGLKKLERTIRKYCPPETWGIDGAMTPRNGFLIISANAVSHVRIAALLNELRKMAA